VPPEDLDRRRAAKRFNERLQLLAAFLNNSGIATLLGGLVLPSFSDKPPSLSGSIAALALALAAHMFGASSVNAVAERG